MWIPPAPAKGPKMSLDRRILALLGRRLPAIYDVFPSHGLREALNPQPIPPGTQGRSSLNPQPIPPLDLGAMVAGELLRLSWVSDHLNTAVDPIGNWEEDPCPTWPKPPKLPPHLPPVPDPEPGPDWIRDYHLGLASTLAAGLEGRREWPLAAEALELSMRSLETSLDET